MCEIYIKTKSKIIHERDYYKSIKNNIKSVCFDENIWADILLYLDLNNLKQLYLLNKTTAKLSISKYFWGKKITQLNAFLPQINPKTISLWILEHNKIEMTLNIATKWINFIIKDKYYDKIFLQNCEPTKLYWLPFNILKIAEDDQNLHLEFVIDNWCNNEPEETLFEERSNVMKTIKNLDNLDTQKTTKYFITLLRAKLLQ